MRLRQDSQERDIYAIAVERIVGVEAGVRARRQSHAILYTGWASRCVRQRLRGNNEICRTCCLKSECYQRTDVGRHPMGQAPALWSGHREKPPEGRGNLRAVSAEGAEAPAEITAR
jgi:hypothetical protein